ncbi:MAG: four helix bundle protein [Betaproteobacteria bacterium]|nr:four helix bundle protein [Betaproteobacteria bacterium]
MGREASGKGPAAAGYRGLAVWQRAKALAVEIYRLTSDGAICRDFGLRDQMRRAAVSVCSNLAEGDERGSDKDSVRFFFMAKGSLAELATQLEIASDVELMNKRDTLPILDECTSLGHAIGALIKARTRDA